ncbi:MAG TPA: hypothetical protein VFA71_14500, partial [Terriglobales bacterium]|nr:hypothetical protein [Terriglobales bacterium]
NHFGATYIARAKTYETMLEFSMDNYFNNNFLNTSTLFIQHPNSTAYNALPSNNVNAWNRSMMFMHAYQTLGQIHEVLGDNSSKATMYKTIVKNWVDLFVKNALPRTAPDGAAIYDWGYGNFGDESGHLTGEQIGIHAQYDIWGLTRAYRAAYTGATAAQMKTYADTVVHEITLSIDSAGAATYAGFNDRCCSTQTYNYLPAGFTYLTPYNTAIFKPAANADINSGRLAHTPGTAADVLWAKHWIFIHSSPPNYTLSAGPGTQTITAGNGTSYTATVTPSNGFNGTVSLSVSGLPSGASCNSPSISGGSGSASLSCSTTISTAPGTYTLTITGTSGSLSHTATVTLVVNQPPPPDFTLSASPATQTVTAGSGTNYAITVGALNGFAANVTLTVSGLPTGGTGSFNPASVNGSGSSTLTVSTASSTSTGTVTLTIKGTSGSLSHSKTVTLTVNPATICTTATANGTWNNTAFPALSGSFTATFDATPSASGQSSAVGISKGAQIAFSGFANIVAFATTGVIQARNGGTYVNSAVHYSGGTAYHFRLAINVTAHTYSIFVTPAGGTEQSIGTNFAFRTEQNTVTSLDHWGALVSTTSTGTLKVCNFTAQ